MCQAKILGIAGQYPKHGDKSMVIGKYTTILVDNDATNGTVFEECPPAHKRRFPFYSMYWMRILFFIAGNSAIVQGHCFDDNSRICLLVWGKGKPDQCGGVAHF